ncbi:Interferon gamma receptor 1 [Oryzias melastigma]|uniref:Interferon gamma receptor 1 n=1 Tax=Oryzias melastigma TaxID=30732 RepID=A0A834BMT0_ORYME|nr:Interferon gamma receptor 1 [Oryzias melastigma]
MPDFCLVVLFFLWTDVALAVVPSPTNVLLHCHNFENKLTWGFAEFPPGLQFKVDISSYSEDNRCLGAQWVEPPKLEVNLSRLPDPEDAYWITVRAVMGQDESDPAPYDGIVFSYNKNTQESQHCSVDLPPLNVTRLSDHQVQIQFQHPWEFYQPKIQSCKKQKRKRQRELPTFKYDVIVQNKTETVYCEESLCEKDVHVDPEQEQCVKIKGEFKNVNVESRGDHCVQPRKEDKPYTYVFIVIAIVTALVAVAILVMLYRKKTQPSTALPHFMKRFILVKPPTMPGVQDPIHPLEVEPSSPTPLISQTDMEDTNTSNYDTRSSPRPVHDEGEAPSLGERPAYMEGRDLEEDEDEEEKEVFRSDYEKRPPQEELMLQTE